MPVVRFAPPHFGNDVSEGAGSLSHTLTLSAASTESVRVTVQGPNYRSGDLQYAAQAVEFAPGQTSAAIYEDTLYEGNEVFQFDIVAASGAELDRSSSDAISFYGYIIDNDVPTLPTVRFAPPHFGNDVSEGASSLSHTLTLSTPSTEWVRATVQGPSYRSGDLQYAAQIVEFAPGQTSAAFSAAVYEDTLYEGNEVFRFEIVAANGAELDRSNSDATSFYGYIIDNDGSSNDDIINGGTGNDLIHGGAGNDTLYGGAGDDTLDGGLNADSMQGGPGDDRHILDNGGDVVIENTGEGADTILSYLDHTIEENVENMNLQAGVFATGNALNNKIDGNSGDNFLSGGDGDDQLSGYVGEDTLEGGAGNDILDGGLNADVMRGGGSNDYYYLDNGGDAAIENVGEGLTRSWRS